MRWVMFIALALGCGSRAEPTVLSLEVTHPTYRVRASLPDGWVADAAHAAIYPADTWTLHAPGQRTPAVILILGWVPRGPRHSAGFPGDRVDDARPETRVIGGAPRAGTVEAGGDMFFADFDVGEVAVSIRTVSDRSSRATIDTIVASLAFDPSVPRPR